MINGFEERRLQDLKSMKLLDTLPEKEYDDITSLAAFICNTPISLVSLVTDTRQFFKSRQGVDVSETPIKQSFCAYAIKVPQQPFIVEDAQKDKRFKDNPLVTGQPKIAFYAGIPLLSIDGNALGTLCVIDNKPRKLEQKQLNALKLLANQVIHLFELRKNRMELKKIGHNLSVESQRLKNIIDATQVGTWEWDISSGKVGINERLAEMLGYSVAELAPLSFEKFKKLLFPKEARFYMDTITACFEKTSNFCQGDYRFLHKNGSIVWINVRGQVVNWAKNGQPLLMAGTHTDITAQKNNELEIEQSEKRFKALVQNGSDLIAILDLEANYQYVSPTSAKVLGISPEEFKGKNAFEFIHPDDKETVYASLLRLENEKQLTLKPFRFKHGEGSWRWIETIITNLMEDSAIKGLVANSRDITARITSEKALKESERRYSDLFHLNPQPMWVYDMATLKFLDVNEAAIKSYGYSYEEFLNMTIRKIRPASEITKIESNLKSVQQEGKHCSLGEHVHTKKNGQEIIVEIRGTILSYKEKRAEVVLATDVTQRYNHIKAIEAQNEKLRKIAWTQSHVVRAPLARIMALIDLLKKDPPLVDQKEREQLLEHVFQSATEFDEIVRNIVTTTQQTSEN